MTVARPWSDDDDAVLRDGWGKRTPTVLAAAVGRTVDSVKSRAKKLGLSRSRYRLVQDGTRQAMDDLAEQMAEGYPSVGEAARRVGLSENRGRQVWSLLVERLGIEQCV